MKIESAPYTGPTLIDIQPIASVLRDLQRGSLQFLRSERAGIEEVEEELKLSLPAVGARAAVSSDVYAELVLARDNVKKIRAMRLIVAKLAEVLKESEAYYEHESETCISLIADAARSAARRKDPSIRAAFEKTLRYVAQTAHKSLLTRRRNKKPEAKPESEPASAP
jgi:GTPase SAR1 family protein